MGFILHIYGASGSGVSTLGKYISDKLGWFFMDTDDYFWEKTDVPFTLKRERDERINMMMYDIASHENVVISGALSVWGDCFIPYFSLCVRVSTDENVRIERLRKREFERFGDRIKSGGDMFEQHEKFIEWARMYDSGDVGMRSRSEHNLWEKSLGCPIVQVDGEDDLNVNFLSVNRKIEEILSKA